MSEAYALFVEDDPDDIELTVLHFQRNAFPLKITIARDGLDALTLLRGLLLHKARLPVLIILDLKMPRMNGLELMAELQRDPGLRGIPVAFLTSSCNQTDRDKALSRGARLYLQKPIKYDEFDQVIQQLRALLPD